MAQSTGEAIASTDKNSRLIEGFCSGIAISIFNALLNCRTAAPAISVMLHCLRVNFCRIRETGDNRKARFAGVPDRSPCCTVNCSLHKCSTVRQASYYIRLPAGWSNSGKREVPQHCSSVVRLPSTAATKMHSRKHSNLSDNREWWIIARGVSASL